MAKSVRLPNGTRPLLDDVIGHLNFSSGSLSPRFLLGLDALYRTGRPETWCDVGLTAALAEWIDRRARQLARTDGPFRDVRQARAVARTTLLELIPRFRREHGDRIVDVADDELYRPFFVARAMQAVLEQGPPWEEIERLVAGALEKLNDYVGYRPVPVLENARRAEPYAREWIALVPLYLRGAGTCCGRYEAIVGQAVEILSETDAEILREAWFDANRLQEIALDPRAVDFEHPVADRANFLFGLWDPHRIDREGCYSRFVLHRVVLDSLISAQSMFGSSDMEQWRFEAGLVLAGTMLMAGGISGWGPQCHDSSTTLATLLPRITAYRDAFYDFWFDRVPPVHLVRLEVEAAQLKQPFGAVRQYLNRELARRRSRQKIDTHVACLFARLGHADAALRQAVRAGLGRAHVLARIESALAQGHLALGQGRVADAPACLERIMDELIAAIECGVLLDPWNILGFGGNFSHFPSPENSVPDPRVDELIDLIERVFRYAARAGVAAGLVGDKPSQIELFRNFDRLATWWDRFATPTVADVPRVVGAERLAAAREVSTALGDWRRQGSEAGRVDFWEPLVERFQSAEAFQLVVDGLLDHDELLASRSLLVAWLREAERVALEDGNASFSRSAHRWMRSALACGLQGSPRAGGLAEACKFMDYLEANAESYGRVPQFRLQTPEPRGPQANGGAPGDELLDESADEQPPPDYLLSSAYEDMIYEDSSDDGFEGETIDAGPGSAETEMRLEGRRLGPHLAYLNTWAQLCKRMVLSACHAGLPDESVQEAFREWKKMAARFCQALLALIGDVRAYQVRPLSSSADGVAEYERCRAAKERLIERITRVAVEMDETSWLLEAAGGADGAKPEPSAALLRRILAGDAAGRSDFVETAARVGRSWTLTYAPTARGGDPLHVFRAKSNLYRLEQLAVWLSRRGWIADACRMLEVVKRIERRGRQIKGAVTEFDRLFATITTSTIRSLVASSESWPAPLKNAAGRSASADEVLVDYLRQLTDTLFITWVRHSQTLRLSVLEELAPEDRWNRFVELVRRYGGDLFTQYFLQHRNIRGILYQGVASWIDQCLEERPADELPRLLQDIGYEVSQKLAVQLLRLALEAVVENFAEYRDYNATTTQSDRGELFYTLVDFLRLQVDYNRMDWTLKPLSVIHQVLVGMGREETAEAWRAEVVQRTRKAANGFLKRYAALSKRYGMKLTTVEKRLEERLVLPFSCDRIRQRITVAAGAASKRGVSSDDAAREAIRTIEQESNILAEKTAGAGLDLPDWLESLEEEAWWVLQCGWPSVEEEFATTFTPRRISLDELRSQLSGRQFAELEGIE